MRPKYYTRIREKGNDERKYTTDAGWVETLIATEAGAVVVHVHRDHRGIERVKIDLIPWTRFDGVRIGTVESIYNGPIGSAIPVPGAQGVFLEQDGD